MTAAGPAQVLVVCTANVCRSPAAASLLRDLWWPGTGVRVESAGTRASPGAPRDTRMRRLVRAAGAVPERGGARPVTAQLVREADLVLTATTAHRAEVLELVPSAVRRTFTLLELARLCADCGPLAGDTTGSRLRALADAAASRRTPPGAGSDDLPDPHGRGRAAYGRSFAEIERAVTRIGDAVRPAPGLPEGRTLSCLAAGCRAPAPPVPGVRHAPRPPAPS